MTGWGDNAVLARLVDALDKGMGQAELDELEPSSLLCLMIRGNGATLVDQGFDVAIVSGGRFLDSDCGLRRKAMRTYPTVC